jgi:cytoskeletal protein CcmA (bactofilin family)
MFRRREDGTEVLDEADNDNQEVEVTESVSFPAASAAVAQPAQPAFRPAPPQAALAGRAPQPSAAVPQAAAGASGAVKPAKRVLTVGPDIQMKGEITTCDRVVIEGMVDATMKDVHTVELAQSGSLKGTAEVEDAEISGVFEGDLVVRGRLIIYSTGVIRGNVTYGEIEIERGGQIAGNIQNNTTNSGKNPARKAA